MAEKQKLDHNQILQAEYHYIANTAFQANEDRSRVISFYFVSTGSLVAAILSAQFAPEQAQNVLLGFALLFSILTALGGLTLAQLARLRSAWHESAQAMNQIKEFYIAANPEIKSAFKWRPRSVPPTNKPYSIANLMALEVELLGGITSGAAAYYLLQVFAVHGAWLWGSAVTACMLGAIALRGVYHSLLFDK